jgi:hypothetical protein
MVRKIIFRGSQRETNGQEREYLVTTREACGQETIYREPERFMYVYGQERIFRDKYEIRVSRGHSYRLRQIQLDEFFPSSFFFSKKEPIFSLSVHNLKPLRGTRWTFVS